MTIQWIEGKLEGYSSVIKVVELSSFNGVDTVALVKNLNGALINFLLLKGYYVDAAGQVYSSRVTGTVQKLRKLKLCSNTSGYTREKFYILSPKSCQPGGSLVYYYGTAGSPTARCGYKQFGELAAYAAKKIKDDAKSSSTVENTVNAVSDAFWYVTESDFLDAIENVIAEDYAISEDVAKKYLREKRGDVLRISYNAVTKNFTIDNVELITALAIKK